MPRRLVWIALALAACNGKDRPPRVAPAPPEPVASAVETLPVHEKIEGPSITPAITDSITFFVPKDAPWWGELSFSCYAAAIRMQPGSNPSSSFTQISPAVEPAMRAADIDLDHDVAAFGIWGCGEAACFYSALALRHPEKLGDMLAVLVPGTTPKRVGKDHFSVEAPGAKGPRTIHMQAIPIAWPDKLPQDPWAREAARATHLVFVTGMFGKDTEVEPLSLVGDGASATAREQDIEAVLPDAHGMCIRGAVGKRAFQPGFKLERARFAFAAPEGKGDPFTSLLDSKRTLDLEVDLALTPAATEAAVARWIAQAREYMSQTMTPLRQQFASQGAVVDIMFDLGALLADNGFRHTLKGNALQLSWRTDRIQQSELLRLEARLRAAGLDSGP